MACLHNDLVLDSKLDVSFIADRGVTVHSYQDRPLVPRTELWQREKKIGAGSYASVWLEKCTKGRSRGFDLRAVKQIDLSGRNQRYEFYNRELEAIAKFSHPRYERCFVKSFGWYETPGTLYITMEYLEPGDLYAYLSDRPPLPEREAKEIIYQVLDGLNMMHGNAFAHRDLKPNNSLIKTHPPNGGWWVKIADFGISKRIDEENGNSTTLRGTPGYIAPELYGFIDRGNPYAVDLWALGEIAFNILTKQTTFKTLGQLFSYSASHISFPTSALNGTGVSQPGIDFILSLMQAIPDSRPPAQKAMSHDWIRNLLSNHAVAGKSASEDDSDVISIDSSFAELESSDATSNFPWANFYTSIYDQGFTMRADDLDAIFDYLGENSTSYSSGGVVIGSPGSGIQLYGTMQDSVQLVTAAAFSPDRRYVAAATDEQAVLIWDISRGVEIRAIREQTEPMRNIVFTPKSGLLVCATVSGVELWRPPAGLKLRRLDPSPRRVQNIAISPNEKYLAFSTDEDKVGIRGLDTDTDVTLPIKSSSIMFTPDGKGLMLARNNIFFWELASGKIFEIRLPRDWLHKLRVFSPCGKVLASVSSFGSLGGDEYIVFWNTMTGEPKRRIRNSRPNRIKSMVFSPNGKLLVTGEIGSIHFWDGSTGEEIYRIEEGSPFEITYLTFSADGTMLISCARSNASSHINPTIPRIEGIKIWKGSMIGADDT